MLRMKVWTLTLGLWAAVTYSLCVLGGVLFPSFPIRHQTLELILPGFSWLTAGSFVLGLVESFVLGAYVAVVLVTIHNLVARRIAPSVQP